MKETIVRCDICGREYVYPGIIDFIPFYGKPVKLFLMGKNRESNETVQMDICQYCALKIEKFLENMKRGEGI